jgi:hypothetical protein
LERTSRFGDCRCSRYTTTTQKQTFSRRRSLQECAILPIEISAEIDRRLWLRDVGTVDRAVGTPVTTTNAVQVVDGNVAALNGFDGEPSIMSLVDPVVGKLQKIDLLELRNEFSLKIGRVLGAHPERDEGPDVAQNCVRLKLVYFWVGAQERTRTSTPLGAST